MCVNFNPKGSLLATGSFDHTVRLWDLSSGCCKSLLYAHDDVVVSAQFDGNGAHLVTAGFDGVVRIWEVKTRKLIKCLPVTSPDIPVCFANWSPNSKFILVGSFDGTWKLLDAEKVAIVRTYTGHVFDDYCLFASFSLTGNKSIISGSADGTVCIWDIGSSELLQKLEGHTDVVVAVAAHPTENLIASGALDGDKTVRLWRLTEMEEEQKDQSEEELEDSEPEQPQPEPEPETEPELEPEPEPEPEQEQEPCTSLPTALPSSFSTCTSRGNSTSALPVKNPSWSLAGKSPKFFFGVKGRSPWAGLGDKKPLPASTSTPTPTLAPPTPNLAAKSPRVHFRAGFISAAFSNAVNSAFGTTSDGISRNDHRFEEWDGFGGGSGGGSPSRSCSSSGFDGDDGQGDGVDGGDGGGSDGDGGDAGDGGDGCDGDGDGDGDVGGGGRGGGDGDAGDDDGGVSGSSGDEGGECDEDGEDSVGTMYEITV
eukprot:TRINITY_DN5586_c0_g2_i4.p1 TRINITY_DN5586_c0_g2~~TRINITY_DN5586_c0_g2_i4.p1  ORF type:complete len:481 (-),score=152.33 TRINITY_DN5586_c0_g2_i4:132-1574(-)